MLRFRFYQAGSIRAGHLLAVDVAAAPIGGAKLLRLDFKRLPVGGYAGIADQPFFGMSFDHNLRQL